MFRLIVLLLGTDTVRGEWKWLAGVGMAWVLLGLFIMADLGGSGSAFATQMLGLLILADGLLVLLLQVGLHAYRRRFFLVRALITVGVGLLILGMSLPQDRAVACILFGIIYFFDGLVRLLASVVVRYAAWPVTAMGAAFELALALMALFDRPLSYERIVPLCVGLATLLSGITVSAFAVRLRRLPRDRSLTSLPWFRAPKWYARSPRAEHHPRPLREPPAAPLLLRIWLPKPGENAFRPPVFDRYIAQFAKDGYPYPGHAALEHPSGLYISHVAVKRIEVTSLVRISNASPENDHDGNFLDTYAYESSYRGPSEVTIRFRLFNLAQLQEFWAQYRVDKTYNVANRSCSIAVALALDAALEGVLAGPQVFRRMLSLMMNPDVWTAAALRSYADSITWTPGLLHDYAQALRRVVDQERLGWRPQVRHAFAAYRLLGRAALHRLFPRLRLSAAAKHPPSP